MTNTKCCNSNNSSSSDNVSLSSLSSNYSNTNGTFHKSLDFSNVNLDSNSYNSYLKQFHQVRLYVKDFENMILHGESVGSSDSTYIISANLPSQFGYNIGSSWEAPLKAFGGSEFNMFMQAAGPLVKEIFGKDFGINSGINRATTLKMWNGTNPLTLTLKIPVIDDSESDSNSHVKTNFAEALEFLGCLCLPKDAGRQGLSFYTPPPSPVSAAIRWKDDVTDENGNVTESGKISFNPTKARIILQVGGMLLVDKCIVEGIEVTYPNTKAMMFRSNDSQGYLSPILADLTIKITTAEALTANVYSKMLNMKSQPDQGTGESDLSGVYNAIKNGINWAGNKLKDIVT